MPDGTRLPETALVPEAEREPRRRWVRESLLMENERLGLRGASSSVS